MIQALPFIAIIPIVVVLILMGVFSWPAKKVMPIAAIISILIARLIWGMHLNWVNASIISGTLIAFEIILIVFGALLLIAVMQKSKKIDVIISNLTSISPDSRVIVIIVGWAFVCFLEAIAGFGTPTAIVAPLLVALGFPAIAAVSIPLIFDSVPVTFGAVGVPINHGIPTAIQGISQEMLMEVTLYSALFHGVVGLFLPLATLGMLTRYFAKEKSWKLGFGAWKFALLGSVSFVVPYVLTAWLIGPELPSIIGSLVCLAVTITFAKKKWLMPKTVWHYKHTPAKKVGAKESILAWMPYGLVATILIATRIPALGLQALVRSVQITFTNILGTSITYANPILYNPGTIFVVVALFCAALFKVSFKDTIRLVDDTIFKLIPATITLVFTIILVRVLLNSGANASGFESMILIPAEALANTLGISWYAFAPFIGSLGSFISGSNTVSNILFAAFQQGVALNLGTSVALVLALQAVGGGIGNMICIHNIVAGCSTVGMNGQESKVLRTTLVPSLVYAAIVGLLGLLAVLFIIV
ncbi:MAG: L-lactate permease [Candidatus Woesearchaeota archaeon]